MPAPRQQDLIQLLAFESEAAKYPFGASLGAIGIGGLVAVLTGFALSVSGIREDMVSTVAGGAGLVPPLVATAWARSLAPKRAEILALSVGRPAKPVVLTVFITGLALFSVKNALLVSFFYAAIGWILTLEVDAATGRRLFDLIYYTVEIPLFLALGYAILRATAHRLGRRALWSCLMAISFAAAIQLTVNGPAGWTDASSLVDLVVFVVLAILAVPAVRSARHSAVPFVVHRLVRGLSPQDAAAVAELIAESESEANRYP